MQIHSLNPAATLYDFDRLESALIDTSSLIYLEKIRMLPCIEDSVKLFSIPGVVREFGGDKMGVEILNPSPGKNTTDQAIVQLALNLEIPLISEDRRILRDVRAGGQACFNSLMMICFLYYKRKIDRIAYDSALQRLRGVARYSERVYAYGESVFNLIRSERL